MTAILIQRYLFIFSRLLHQESRVQEAFAHHDYAYSAHDATIDHSIKADINKNLRRKAIHSLAPNQEAAEYIAKLEKTA
jgi:hypothetical protein